MKHIVICGLAIAAAITSTPSMAAIRYEEGPQPVTIYNVCNYNAVFEVNTQARRLRAGGPSLELFPSGLSRDGVAGSAGL
ncbi:hypothetical protein [Lichenibacterium dinghuense]|uniref:hypothetical protein n=1 Tax=Lichenibacterium dinghuense TaxID=2895977 RepID=UPI001F28C6DA|nr:hypothetical protein [Lichenibacterium sp. 6Y81]